MFSIKTTFHQLHFAGKILMFATTISSNLPSTRPFFRPLRTCKPSNNSLRKIRRGPCQGLSCWEDDPPNVRKTAKNSGNRGDIYGNPWFPFRKDSIIIINNDNIFPYDSLWFHDLLFHGGIFHVSALVWIVTEPPGLPPLLMSKAAAWHTRIRIVKPKILCLKLGLLLKLFQGQAL